MNLELILWIAAGIVISEIIFIIWSLCSDMEDEGTIGSHWILRKILSFTYGALFITIQVGIVFVNNNSEIGTIGAGNYIYLVYEAIGLVALGLIFLLNWLIAKKIDKMKEKKK